MKIIEIIVDVLGVKFSYNPNNGVKLKNVILLQVRLYGIQSC
jgi:hypothetical protein